MDNRMNILEKALHLFYEKGYDAIGVQEIADAAGVTKPTLYHYFGSKYGLLQAVAMEGYADLQTGMAEAIQYQGDLQLNLERMTNFYFKFCSSHEAYYRLMMAMMYSAKESDTYKAIRPYMSEITAMMTQLFVSAGGRIGNMRGRQEQYSIVFFGLLNSYMLYWFNKSSKDRPALSEHQAYELVHQFLHGIYV